MIKYKSIEHFRHIVKAIKHKYSDAEKLPKLKFTARVKLHGANCSVVFYKDGRTQFQSRNNILSLDQDNYGFMAYMSNPILTTYLNAVRDSISFNDYIAIYGEWCGEGIQRKVALQELPKMFVIFAIDIDGVIYQPKEDITYPSLNIYNINQFRTWGIDIDFNDLAPSIDTLNELTIEVENECPVAKQLGVFGIGEGIIVTCNTDSTLIFKVKGDKHSVSDVSSLANLYEKDYVNINELVNDLATINRFKQAVESIEVSSKDSNDNNNVVGLFIKWVINDIYKEEATILNNSKVNKKIFNNLVSKKAKEWYYTHLLHKVCDINHLVE